jgi:hypothetical protein
MLNVSIALADAGLSPPVACRSLPVDYSFYSAARVTLLLTSQNPAISRQKREQGD